MRHLNPTSWLFKWLINAIAPYILFVASICGIKETNQNINSLRRLGQAYVAFPSFHWFPQPFFFPVSSFVEICIMLRGFDLNKLTWIPWTQNKKRGFYFLRRSTYIHQKCVLGSATTFFNNRGQAIWAVYNLFLEFLWKNIVRLRLSIFKYLVPFLSPPLFF